MRRSWVWEFYIKSSDGREATCKICNQVLSFRDSTSSLAKHLQCVHKKQSTDSSRGTASTSQENENYNSWNDLQGRTCEPYSKRRRTENEKHNCSTEKQEEISRALAKMIALNQMPLSFSNSIGFAEFMSSVEPGYKIQQPNTILARIHLLYNDVRAIIEKELVDCSNIALTTDTWTSSAQDSYLSVTAHVICNDWTLKKYCLATNELEERHTSENIALELEMVAQDWGISSKVSAIVHDNASNVTAAVCSMGTLNICCASHTLQLAVNEGLRIEEIRDVCDKAKCIVKYFHKSNLAAKSLETKQKQLGLKEQKLIRFCQTRSSSTYLMCERLLVNRNAIAAVLSDRNTTRASKAQQLEVSEAQWTLMEDIIKILKPMQVTTTVFCSDDEVTISSVRPVIHGLVTKHLRRFPEGNRVIENFKNKIKTELIARFKLNKPIADLVSPDQIATILDPRFKNLDCEYDEEKEKIRENLKLLLMQLEGSQGNTSNEDNFVEIESKQSALDFLFQVDKTINNDCETQFFNYLAEPKISHNMDPLLWWKNHSDRFPGLSKLARNYLSIPATSAASERTFSSAGNTVTDKRNCLDPGHVNTLVFLHQNRDYYVK